MVSWRFWGCWSVRENKNKKDEQVEKVGNGDLKWDEAKGQRAACKSE